MIGKFLWADGQLKLYPGFAKTHSMKMVKDAGASNYAAGEYLLDPDGPNFDVLKIDWRNGVVPSDHELQFLIRTEVKSYGREARYRRIAEDLWDEFNKTDPDQSAALIRQIENMPGARRLRPIPNEDEIVFEVGDRVAFEHAQGSTGTVVETYPPYAERTQEYIDYISGGGPIDEEQDAWWLHPSPRWTYDVRWDYKMNPHTFELSQPGEIGPMIDGKSLWPEGDVRLEMAYGATSEDTEPEGKDVGFLRDPRKELYPPLFRGGDEIPVDAANKIKAHVLNALEAEFEDPDNFIYFTIYGSGISYNWDEAGDMDVQMWVDVEKFQNLNEEAATMTVDDLVAAVRRIVQPINFPTFKDLGFVIPEGDADGSMMIQYYPKPGKGTKEENLASKPYACYDLETNEWLERAKPIKPTFYGQHFLALEPKCEDIALQAEALLGELTRNVLNWQFWYSMWERFRNHDYKARFEEARAKAEQEKEGVKSLFDGIFGGRAKAYTPEGKGIEDERDMVQKMLEVWGIFQKLKHYAREPLPWEETELPAATEEGSEPGSAEDNGKNSMNHVETPNEYSWVVTNYGSETMDLQGDWVRWAANSDNFQSVLDYYPGERLQGYPGPVQVRGYGQLDFGAHSELQELAQQYGERDTPRVYAPVNPDRAARIAEEYERMPHNPNDPAVKASYDAFIKETMQQYKTLTDAGYTFEFYPSYNEGMELEDPYPNGPREAILDLYSNKHLYVYPTYAGFGQTEVRDHPLLQDAGVKWGDKQVTYNDIFRAVHDVFGHAKEGVGFRADGEENAWRQHAAMYSDLARPAMTAETRGQNSWVNFGPHGQANQKADQMSTVYAEQKAGIMPEWTWQEGADDSEFQTSQGGFGAFSRIAMPYVDNTWYHVTDQSRLPAISQQGLRPAGTGIDRVWKDFEVEPDAVYLWPNFNMAYVYLTSRGEMWPNPVVLRVRGIDRSKIAPDHETFESWMGNQNYITHEREPLEQQVVDWLEQEYPVGGSTIEILRAMPVEWREELARELSEQTSEPIMYYGTISADQIEVGEWPGEDKDEHYYFFKDINDTVYDDPLDDSNAQQFTWTPVRQMAMAKTAAWADVMADATELYSGGMVSMVNNTNDHVYGEVASQSQPGVVYPTEIWPSRRAELLEQGQPNYPIALWSCECEWGQHSWGRTRQFKKFEGRPCKHVLALFWTSVGQTPEPDMMEPGAQQEIPGMGDMTDPLRATIPGQSGGPVIPGTQPQQQQESELTTPNDAQNEQLTFPGTFSSWRKTSAFANGDYVRSNMKTEGEDERGTFYTVPRNKIGEVIWSDEEETIVIFSLESKALGPFNVRVTAPTTAFSWVPRTRGTAPRRHR
jgi:hypothetical protein